MSIVSMVIIGILCAALLLVIIGLSLNEVLVGDENTDSQYQTLTMLQFVLKFNGFDDSVDLIDPDLTINDYPQWCYDTEEINTVENGDRCDTAYACYYLLNISGPGVFFGLIAIILAIQRHRNKKCCKQCDDRCGRCATHLNSFGALFCTLAALCLVGASGQAMFSPKVGDETEGNGVCGDWTVGLTPILVLVGGALYLFSIMAFVTDVFGDGSAATFCCFCCCSLGTMSPSDGLEHDDKKNGARGRSIEDIDPVDPVEPFKRSEGQPPPPEGAPPAAQAQLQMAMQQT